MSRSNAVRLGASGGALLGVAVAVALGLSWDAALVLAVPLVFLFSLGSVHAVDRPDGAWTRRLRRRFLLGVPWGSLVTIGGVAGFYLFVQGGLAHPNDPLTLPFTSWSLLYPLGILTAPFAHVSVAHITGNLLGTVVYAPLAEYAWSHYPSGDRGDSRSGTVAAPRDGLAARWLASPVIRAFVLFPVGVFCVGVLTSFLAWGAVIGFSGVLFAMGAFALTRYPVAVVVAVAARSLVSAVYHALRAPVVVASAQPSYGGPWWANVAVQTHATGVFLGVLLGALLVARRDERPSALRLWGAAVVYAASVPLYIIWWYRGPSTYVLYRGLGVLFVVLVGLLVAAGVTAGARPLVSRVDLGVTRRQVATLCLVFPLLLTAFVAVPVDLTSVAGGPPANAANAVHVGGYTVTYAEAVPNRRVEAVNVSFLNDSTRVNASGVIVSNPSRHLWTEAVSAGRLGFTGSAAVRVGGLGWSRVVRAKRRGWDVAGGETVYRVALSNATGAFHHVYSSPNATADFTVDGRRVTVANVPSGFSLVVTLANETLGPSHPSTATVTLGGGRGARAPVLGRTPLPASNATATAGGVEFVRNGDRLRAVRGGTNVTVAVAETYH